MKGFYDDVTKEVTEEVIDDYSNGYEPTGVSYMSDIMDAYQESILNQAQY